MSSTGKKVLALMLALAMLTSLFCLSAFGKADVATSGDGTGSKQNVNLNKGALVMNPLKLNADGIGTLDERDIVKNNMTEKEQLAAITSQVKKTLGIDDSYSDFYGEPYSSYIKKTWNLTWSKDESDKLSVTATSTGKILRYHRYVDNEYETADIYSDDYNPKFEDDTTEIAKVVAKKFLSQVMLKNESFTIKEARYYWKNNNGHSFEGDILINGVKSPLTYSISIEPYGDSMIVTDFSRADQSSYPGEVPSIDKYDVKASNEVKEQLKSIIDFKVEWDLDSDGKTAILKYIPTFNNEYYVDAATGKLKNIAEVRTYIDTNETNKGAGVTGDAMNSATEGANLGLSEKELEGIDKLTGMLTQEQLDNKIRTEYTELGLSSRKFTLADIRYIVYNDSESKDKDISATITYSRVLKDKDGYNDVERRTITVDAKTGKIKSVGGWDAAGNSQKEVSTTSTKALETAKRFASKVWNTEFSTMELYNSNEPKYERDGYSYTFAQKHNGYFLPSNFISITVSCVDNTIVRATYNFNNEVKFTDISNMKTMDEAKDIWLNSYPMMLSYIAIPTAIDLIGRDYLMKDVDYTELGYDYLYNLVPGYMMNHREKNYSTIDAVTGELKEYSWYYSDSDKTIEYTGLSNNQYSDQYLRLAEMNIGYTDGKPTGTLTQADMLTLLATVDGYGSYTDDKDNKTLYNWAYMRGVLTKEERNDTKQITNLEAAKMLINALGYGKIAKLDGVYSNSTKDFVNASVENKGYVALVHGLKMVTVDNTLNIIGTRESGMMILYNFMLNNK